MTDKTFFGDCIPFCYIFEIFCEKLTNVDFFLYFCHCLLHSAYMKKSSFLYRVFDLYYDGFRHMTLGKTLWAIILIKLVVIFVILKLLFFPNFIKEKATEGHEADFVEQQMLDRTQTP